MKDKEILEQRKEEAKRLQEFLDKMEVKDKVIELAKKTLEFYSDEMTWARADIKSETFDFFNDEGNGYDEARQCLKEIREMG